jgi:chemosensory pili system protein ChpC
MGNTTESAVKQDAATVIVASQVLPLAGGRLVLPNTAVAEIAPLGHVEASTDGPAWLLGHIDWRGLTLPLVSYERAQSEAAAVPEGGDWVAVLNALDKSRQDRFYAVLMQGIPRLVQLGHGRLDAAPDEERLPLVLQPVLVDGESAVIPDLEALEALVFS